MLGQLTKHLLLQRRWPTRIARFGDVVHPAPQAAQSDEHIKLGALVERRRQLLDLVNQEQNRLQQTADAEIRKSIQTVLKGLKAQVKKMDQRIAKAVEADVAPMNNDSEKTTGKRKTTGGRHTVRRTLYMATLVTTRFNPTINAFYLDCWRKENLRRWR